MREDEKAVESLGDLDEVLDELSPQDAVTESLRTALTAMRAEADRIATLGSGSDLVTSAEQFADGAGQLDEQLGAAARTIEGDGLPG